MMEKDPVTLAWENVPITVVCERCKETVEHSKTESLRFASKHKQTTLRLCLPCFQSAREVFIDWLGGEEIQS